MTVVRSKSLSVAMHTVFIKKPIAQAVQITLLGMLSVSPLLAYAQASGGTQASVNATRNFDLPAGPLASTISRFAAAAGVAISFDAAHLGAAQSSGLKGSYTVEQGFAQLLRGSGVEAVNQGNGNYVLQKASSAASNSEAAVLPTVTARADRESATSPVDGYVARRTGTATKTDTPILEIPQSISVIGRTEMEARGAQNIMDIVANTPGIAVNTYGPDNRGWDDISLRGFSDFTSNYRDGLPQSAFEIIYRMTEPYGVERVEVLRGPASVMFGQGDAGGVIHRISKRPTAERVREIELQYGSFDRKQIAFDLGDKIGDSDLSYRLVGVALDSNDQDQYPNGQKINRTRNYLAPSFRWQPSAATSLTVLGEFLRHESGEDPYYAIDGNSNLTNVKIGDPSFSRFKQDQAAIGYQFEHILSDAWTVRQNARYSDVSLDRRVLWVDELQADGHTYTREKRTWNDRLQQFTLDTQLQGKLRTGSVEQTLLFGVDWNHLEGTVDRYSDAGPDLDLLNPVYGLSVSNPTTPLATFTQKINQIGVYAQDQIKFNDHWLLTLGGRQDYVKKVTDDTLNATYRTQGDHAFSGRAGLGYLFSNGWSPYVSYAESFLPSLGLDSNNNPFKPSRGKQLEAGVKFQPSGSRSLFTAAVFDLRKTNVVTYQDVSPYAARQIGKQRSRGLELEAKTELARGLNATASYTRLDMTILESAASNEVGKAPATVPNEMASIWLDYAIGNGFGIGGGVNYIGKRPNDESNSSFEGGFSLVNAMLRYETGQWRFMLNASNLFNRQYNSICYHGECYRGAERAVTATARYKF